MNIDKINSIIELFKNSGIDELSVESKDLKITMKNNNVSYITTENIVSPQNVVSPNIVKKETQNIETKKEVEEKEVKGEWIKAPFVGVFYDASSPTDAPYIKVGQKVKEGDVLCILEAMKVMNEIKSNKTGTILEIKAQKGNMVEFGEELILIGD